MRKVIPILILLLVLSDTTRANPQNLCAHILGKVITTIIHHPKGDFYPFRSVLVKEAEDPNLSYQVRLAYDHRGYLLYDSFMMTTSEKPSLTTLSIKEVFAHTNTDELDLTKLTQEVQRYWERGANYALMNTFHMAVDSDFKDELRRIRYFTESLNILVQIHKNMDGLSEPWIKEQERKITSAWIELTTITHTFNPQDAEPNYENLLAKIWRKKLDIWNLLFEREIHFAVNKETDPSPFSFQSFWRQVRIYDPQLIKNSQPKSEQKSDLKSRINSSIERVNGLVHELRKLRSFFQGKTNFERAAYNLPGHMALSKLAPSYRNRSPEYFGGPEPIYLPPLPPESIRFNSQTWSEPEQD